MAADTTLEKPLPNNLEAERSVLGAILLDNHALNAAIETLRPEDFFLDQHRRVFTHMIALGESQQAIDLVTLTDELHCKGELEASGGAPYLASLADGMPRVSNIEYYARIVKEKAILRNLIHATHDIQQRAFEGEEGADAILDGAESSIFALAEDRVRAGLIPVKDIVRDNFERLERIFKEGKSVTGVPTAYTELDKLTSGLQPSELLILAARPSQGKTALALNLMENIAIRGGHPVAMFSLEMSKESLLQRFLGHFQAEHGDRMAAANGDVFHQVQRQRGFSLRRPRGKNEQLRRLQAGGELVQFRVGRGNPGDALAFFEDSFQALKVVANDVLHRDQAGAHAVFGQRKDGGLGAVENGVGTLFSFKRALLDIMRGVNQVA